MVRKDDGTAPFLSWIPIIVLEHERSASLQPGHSSFRWLGMAPRHPNEASFLTGHIFYARSFRFIYRHQSALCTAFEFISMLVESRRVANHGLVAACAMEHDVDGNVRKGQVLCPPAGLAIVYHRQE